MKFSSSFVMSLVAVVALSATAFADSFTDTEASGTHSNDSTATASVLSLTAGANSIRGDITEASDVDFFAITFPALGLTSFSVFDPAGGDSGPADYVLALYDPDGNLYIADDNSASGGALGGDPQIVANIQRAGTWYIAVSIFDYIPTPVAIGIGLFGQGGPGGALAGPSPFKVPLGPGEVGEFKLDPTLTAFGGPFFGDDSYSFLGNQGFLDPPFVITIIANPEPGTFALFGLGLVGLVGLGRRRRRLRIQAAV